MPFMSLHWCASHLENIYLAKAVRWKADDQTVDHIDHRLITLITTVITLITNWSAEEAWGVFQHDRVVQEDKVIFDQFKVRLKGYIKTFQVEQKRSLEESEALAHDRALYARKTHNQRGELVFDLSPAKELLRQDISAAKHVSMSAANLQKTRAEYMKFRTDIFRRRVKQEVMRQKYVAHLNRNRMEKVKREAKTHGTKWTDSKDNTY